MVDLLAEVVRGPVVESRHFGHIAVCNSKGDLLAWAGDPDTVTFMRSAAKPIQTLNVFSTGAYDRYGFTAKEIAIMCGSHYGEAIHKETILGILDKIGLTQSALLCGDIYSIREETRFQQIWDHETVQPFNSDCSGKHCGFLASCLVKGYPLENYNKIENPLQQLVLEIFSDVTGVPAEEIGIGIDGCGVPVHAIPVRNMAMAYARMANPEALPEKYRRGAKIIFDSMNAAPEMLAGTGGFCTEFNKNTHGKFMGKVGAEAVYCIGVKGRDLGIAVKIEDGNRFRPLYPVVMSALQQLGLLEDDELLALKQFVMPPVPNDVGIPVGIVRPCFELKSI